MRVKSGLAEMLKGGVIMDVTDAEQARIAEDAGACAVMALERVPADIRRDGGVARMADPTKIREIQEAVTIPVMAKARIGHFVEAQVLQALEVDYIDESEVLTPADESHHIDKWKFTVPFVCGATNLGEALRRDRRGRGDDPHQGRGGHRQRRRGGAPHALDPRRDQAAAGDGRGRAVRRRQGPLARPTSWCKLVAEHGRLPVVNFTAGGHRDAGRRGADDAAGRRRRVRRLGHLQERRPGRARGAPSSRRPRTSTTRQMRGRGVDRARRARWSASRSQTLGEAGLLQTRGW